MDVVIAVAGLFVGGKGSRMGGAAKGLLEAPEGGAIVLRTKALVEAAGARPVLVGAHPAYRDLGLPIVPDDPSTEGPLAGLLALLAHAHASLAHAPALAIACDLPHLTEGLLARLLAAPPAPVVAPRRRHPDRGWLWEPLCARYDPAAMLPLARAHAASRRSRLQSLLDEAGAVPLALEPADDDALTDWDTPSDVVAYRSR